MNTKIWSLAGLAFTLVPSFSLAQESTPLRVLIGSLPTAGYTGALYYAEETGMYDAAGLDVDITVGKGSHASINALIAGSADVVVAAGLAALQNAEKGQSVVVIGAQLGRNGTGFFVPQGQGISSLNDLEGRNVLFLNAGTEEVFRAMLSQSGGNPDNVQMTQVPQVGTAFGMYIGERADAIMTIILGKAIIGGARPSEFFGIDQLGSSEPTFGWMVTPEYLAENEEILRKFLSVTYAAISDLNENPELVVEPFVKNTPGAKPEAALQDYLDVLDYQCAPEQTIVGRMSDEAWQVAVDLYKSVGQLSEEFDVSVVYTNRFFEQDSVSATSCP